MRVAHDSLHSVGLLTILGDALTSTFEREEIDAIVDSATVGIDEQTVKELPHEDNSPKDAWLSVYSPVFDVAAAQWRFRLGTDVIYADISETSIAAAALARGGASPNDAYNVQLEITQPTGTGRPHFKIIKVLRFIPVADTPRQELLDLGEQPAKRKPARRLKIKGQGK